MAFYCEHTVLKTTIIKPYRYQSTMPRSPAKQNLQQSLLIILYPLEATRLALSVVVYVRTTYFLPTRRRRNPSDCVQQVYSIS